MESRLVIQHYPDRQKPCLVLEQGNQGIILATFRNEYCANILKAYWGGYGLSRKEDTTNLDEMILSLGGKPENEA